MIEVNAMGEACPIPVVKTLHALQELNGAGTVHSWTTRSRCRI